MATALDNSLGRLDSSHRQVPRMPGTPTGNSFVAGRVKPARWLDLRWHEEHLAQGKAGFREGK